MSGLISQMELPSQEERVSLKTDVSEDMWALLAGLRFFLASTVVVVHSSALFPPSWLFGASFIANFGGLQCVLAFLIVSGFSIAHSVSREPHQFYERRFWRIAPTYLACFILATLPLAYLSPTQLLRNHGIFQVPGSLNDYVGAILNLICLQGWITPTIQTFGQSWSMSVEVFFYALAPLAARFSNKILLRICTLSVVSYALYSLNKGFIPVAHFGCPEALLLWAWLGGFLIYRVRHNLKAMFWLPFLLVPEASFEQYPIAIFGSVPLAATCLIFMRGNDIQLSSSIRRLLNYLGDLSLPLYLCHLVILQTVLTLWWNAPGCIWALAYSATLVMSVILFHLVDAPVKAWRRSLKRR